MLVVLTDQFILDEWARESKNPLSFHTRSVRFKSDYKCKRSVQCSSIRMIGQKISAYACVMSGNNCETNRVLFWANFLLSSTHNATHTSVIVQNTCVVVYTLCTGKHSFTRDQNEPNVTRMLNCIIAVQLTWTLYQSDRRMQSCWLLAFLHLVPFKLRHVITSIITSTTLHTRVLPNQILTCIVSSKMQTGEH